MTKDNKNTIYAIFLLILLVIFYIIRNIFIAFIPNYVYLFGSLLISVFISQILTNSVVKMIEKPQKKTSRKESKIKPVKNSNNSNGHLTDYEILKTPLEKLSWREFERLCYLYYKAKGYKPTETDEGADGGVDLIIYDRQYRADVAVQIKHYINSGNRITVKEIRELDSAKKNHNCILTKFITSSTYTKDALIEADERKMDVHDIYWIKSNIEKWRENLTVRNSYR